MIATVQPKTLPFEIALNHFPRFAVDEQLALLWEIYQTTDRIPGGTPLTDFARLMCDRLCDKSPEDQHRILRDLASNTDTHFCREYGGLSTEDKLAFWPVIFRKIQSGDIHDNFRNYHLSPPAQEFLNTFHRLDPIPQTRLLTSVVDTLGVNPIAGSTLVATR